MKNYWRTKWASRKPNKRFQSHFMQNIFQSQSLEMNFTICIIEMQSKAIGSLLSLSTNQRNQRMEKKSRTPQDVSLISIFLLSKWWCYVNPKLNLTFMKSLCRMMNQYLVGVLFIPVGKFVQGFRLFQIYLIPNSQQETKLSRLEYTPTDYYWVEVTCVE